MANSYFRFKQFTVHQQAAGMKVTTDACLFGAWAAHHMQKGPETFFKTLDIGTGTGLLSLMMAQKVETQIDAVEIEKGAALQASENFARSTWSDRLNVIEGDVQKLKLPQYNCIISNPPFYERELASPDKQRQIAHHGSGLKLQSLLRIIENGLKVDGTFYLLLPTKRQKDFETFLASSHLQAHDIVWVQQTPTHVPFRMMVKGGKLKQEVTVQNIIIKDEKGQYTPTFVALLQDYYLYL